MILKQYKSAILFLLFLCTWLTNAQTTAEGWVVENIHGPSQVGIVDSIPVDINHDGLMDVVSVSIEDGHLRAYINQGALTFEQQYISTDVLGAFRVSAADLNFDNQTDFLIPSIESNEIIALIADPSALPYGYRKQIIAAGVLLPTDALAGDFNNDDLMDVVSLSFEENLLLLHTQNNQGSFNTTVISNSPQRPRKLVVDDFNNDQLLDILVASSEDNSVRLFRNDGGNSFTEILISDQLVGVTYITLCDYETTSFPDFAAGVNGVGQVVFFNNINGNNFISAILDDNLPGANAIHCANIDNDEDLELISISNNLGTIYSQEITGLMNKQLVAFSRDGYLSTNVAKFQSTDQPLILTQSFFEQRNLLYFPGQENQEFVIWEDFPDGVREVATADLSGNGMEDIAVSNFRSNELILYANNGDGERVVIENLMGVNDVVLVDLDGNQFIDILVTTAFGDEVFWYQNMNGNVYTQHLVSGDLDNPQRVGVADMNGDQKLDVVVTSSLDDAVWWFDRSDDTFTGNAISANSDGAKGICIFDFTGEGMNDVAVTNFFGGSVDLWTNNNNGSSFTKVNLVSGLLRPDKVECIDLDEDGDMDLVVSVSGDGQMLYIENHGGLGFKANVLVDNLNQPRGFSHFEVDDKLNLVIADNQSSEAIEVREVLSDKQRVSVLAQPLLGINSIISVSPKEVEEVRLYSVSAIDSTLRKLTYEDCIFSDGFNP